MSENNQDLKKTPLYEKHLELGAKMVPFSGWNMPLRYTGIIAEHLHTRQKASLFDVCHMGELFMKGPLAEGEIDRLVTCRVDDMPEGRCRYGFMLNENGGIIDDLIVFKISPEEFMLVVNAASGEKDKAWIKKNIASPDIFSDGSDEISKLDVQGPLSVGIMRSLAGKGVIGGLKRYRFVKLGLGGADVLLSRTGYTGEEGYELFFPAEFTIKFWDMLLGSEGVRPAGLGARDTLRMEMGYSLYGNDIDEEHTPFEANLSKFVYMEKDFVGREALLRQKGENAGKILTGFICEGRRSARKGFSVMVEGKTAGEVTSGAFSPCLKKGIGMCYIERKFLEEGRRIVLTDAKTEVGAFIKSAPVYEKGRGE